MLKARRCVREMREYHSPLSSATIHLRLDMNESTTGCSPRVLAKLNSMDARTLALYPRREPGEKLVAEFMGVAAEHILLTNGADEGIDLLCRAYLEPGSEIVAGHDRAELRQHRPIARSAGGALSVARELRGIVPRRGCALLERVRAIHSRLVHRPTGLGA